MADYNILLDQELTALLKEGDHAAFKELYNRYWAIMMNVAYKRLESKDASEEVVQDLFVTLFLKRETLNIISNLEGYLKIAVKRKVLNAYRTQQTHNKYLESIIFENQIERYSPDQSLQIKELTRKVELATEKMPHKCREVFILSRVDSMSNRSIAEKLGISVSTVEKHIHKAMELMKGDLNNYNFSFMLCLLLLKAL